MDSDEVIMFILESLAPSLAGSVVFAVQTREMSHAAQNSGAAPALGVHTRCTCHLILGEECLGVELLPGPVPTHLASLPWAPWSPPF